MARTIYGNHQRFRATYFSTFPGKYFTGDGCKRDVDGLYRITGRGDDVIRVSGPHVGAAGVAAAGRELPDLILMDLSLPVLSGWDAARQLKAADATRAIPIIALSAHALDGEREKALAAGCDDFETKPVDLARLLAKIERLKAGGAA